MEQTAVDVWNRMDESSLFNTVSAKIQSRLVAASQERPDLFGVDESSLKKKLQIEGHTISKTDERIRVAFWAEFFRCKDSATPFRMENLFLRRAFSDSYFYNFLKEPHKVAFLVQMPSDIDLVQKEAWIFGLEQMRDVLSIPHVYYDRDGNITKVDTKQIEQKIKIFSLLDNRLNGAYVQRIEQKSMNLNMTASEKNVDRALSDMSMDEIQKRLVDLEKRDRLAIDVKPEETK